MWKFLRSAKAELYEKLFNLIIPRRFTARMAIKNLRNPIVKRLVENDIESH